MSTIKQAKLLHCTDLQKSEQNSIKFLKAVEVLKICVIFLNLSM